jgi:hypothetical protein
VKKSKLIDVNVDFRFSTDTHHQAKTSEREKERFALPMDSVSPVSCLHRCSCRCRRCRRVVFSILYFSCIGLCLCVFLCIMSCLVIIISCVGVICAFFLIILLTLVSCISYLVSNFLCLISCSLYLVCYVSCVSYVLFVSYLPGLCRLKTYTRYQRTEGRNIDIKHKTYTAEDTSHKD